MDPFGPQRKKLRPDVFGNGNGGIASDMGGRRFNPPPDGGMFGDTARYKQPPSLGNVSEMESFPTGLGSKSKACTKFFSTSGCPFGENCHFMHYVPGGVNSIPQVANTALSTVSRKTAGPAIGLMPSDQGGAVQPYKTKMCNRYGTGEGCRFGDKCHFAHSEKELRKGNASAHDINREHMVGPYGRSAPGGLDGRIGGRPGQREPTPPGMSAAASFGLSSTAKISVDASLAGAIIGKGGVNSKQICRLTGVKLAIREHESDPNLKNIELEGSIDQISEAQAMVRELLIHTSVAPPKPSGYVSNNYKTKMCENFSKGSCTFGERCIFAHGASELR
uniref:C3H1-type domain-containing protein n=1 Tax=Araucaria cunninghamii TaxID=56994 RepID=A0A0D6R0I0_ARACU